MFRLLLLAASFLLSPLSQASDIFGNGGDVISCPSKYSQLLDFYEGRTMRGIEPDFFGMVEGGGGVFGHVGNALARLRTVDPVRADKLQGWAATFERERVMVPNATLADINDSGHLAIPKGCTVEQIAIQITPKVPQDPRYIISEDLWNSLDALSKGGLILHELVYRDALEAGHTNSMSARYLNSLLNSKYFLSATRETYGDSMYRAQLPYMMPLNALYNGKKVYLMHQLDSEMCTIIETDTPIDGVAADLGSMWPGAFSVVTKRENSSAYHHWTIQGGTWTDGSATGEPKHDYLLCTLP